MVVDDKTEDGTSEYESVVLPIAESRADVV